MRKFEVCRLSSCERTFQSNRLSVIYDLLIYIFFGVFTIQRFTLLSLTNIWDYLYISLVTFSRLASKSALLDESIQIISFIFINILSVTQFGSVFVHGFCVHFHLILTKCVFVQFHMVYIYSDFSIIIHLVSCQRRSFLFYILLKYQHFVPSSCNT